MTPIVRKNFAVLQDLTPLACEDPFDRLLVAQALHEPMHLITYDSQLVGYGDMIMRI